MGTFHHDTHELHGITVVIDVTDGSLIVGRFHEQDATHALLLDADTHKEGEAGKSNAVWLKQAVQWGQWPRLKQLRVPLTEVKNIRKIGDLAAQ